MKRIIKIALLSGGAFGLVYFGIDHDAFAQTLRDVWGNRVRRAPVYNPPNLAFLRFAAIATSGAGGFAVGWFMSPKAAGLRKYLLMAVAAILVLMAVLNNSTLGWGLTPFVSVAAFMIGFGYWARGAVKRFMEAPTTFGSARWATIRELLMAGFIGVQGFRLGFMRDEIGVLQPLSYNSDRHALLMGPNRSKKGTAVIIPNLLTYEGSMIVIDPKGENAMITAARRKRMGQDVHVIDPWGITGLNPSRFNPMDWLVVGDPDIGENSLLLADAIIMMESKGEPFFDHSSKGYLDGLILFNATDEDEAGQRNLGRVRDLLMLDGEDLEKLFKRMLKSPLHKVRMTGASMLQKEPKLISNILASVQAQTNFLDSPRLGESLSHSNFKFEDVKSKPTTIYLVLPADRLNAYGRWLRLLIQQGLTIMARDIENKPEKSVLFILDEMPALGKLAMIETAFGLMAGFGLQIQAICQDASQLKRIYGDGWETFVSNAGVIQYFGSRDNFTADYFSKLCGVTTIWDISTGVSRAFGRTSGGHGSTSDTTTTSDTSSGKQRQLAYADELMRMPSHHQLVLIENMNPIIAEKQPWFENDALKDLGVNLYAKDAD